MIHYLMRVCLALGVWLGGNAALLAQDATSILDKASVTYDQANGISASFTMLTKTPANGKEEPMEGTVQMKGEKFVLSTPGMCTWFDGKTQWSYVENNEEVNVSTPSGNELKATNPVLLLNSYKKGFKAKYMGESTAFNGKTVYDIELTPRIKADIEKVEIQIDKFKSLPATFKVIAKNGVTTTIQISQMKTGVNQPDASFVFNEADYPDAEVIDLR